MERNTERERHDDNDNDNDDNDDDDDNRENNVNAAKVRSGESVAREWRGVEGVKERGEELEKKFV